MNYKLYWYAAKFKMDDYSDWDTDYEIIKEVASEVEYMYGDDIYMIKFHRRANRDSDGRNFTFWWKCKSNKKNEIIKFIKKLSYIKDNNWKKFYMKFLKKGIEKQANPWWGNVEIHLHEKLCSSLSYGLLNILRSYDDHKYVNWYMKKLWEDGSLNNPLLHNIGMLLGQYETNKIIIPVRF